MTQLFSNTAATILEVAIDNSNTSLEVSLGTGDIFSDPGFSEYELITLHNVSYSQWEVVSLELRSGDILTVARGVEGIQQPWPIGTYVSANVTAKTLRDLTETLEATTAVAEDALAKAEEALASGGGGVFGAVLMASITVGRDNSSREYKNINYGSFIYNTIDSDLTDKQYPSAHALPNFGYTLEDFQAVMVFRNSLPCVRFDVDNVTGQLNDDSEFNMFQIVGPRNIVFWPPLQYYERVTIYAPAADWVEHGNLGSYMDVYSATGVQYSYIAGGYSLAGATTKTIDRFDWNLFVTRVQSSPIELKYNIRHGSGAISDSNGYIFFFGGGDPDNGTSTYNLVHRLSIDPSAMRNDLATPDQTTYGHSFTDTVYAWICGYGATRSDNAILKYDLALETGSVIAAVTNTETTIQVSSACDATIGYILQPVDNLGSDVSGFMSKLFCSTDALTAAVALGYRVSGPSAFLMFRDGSSYIWGASSPALLKYDLATDVVSATFTVSATPPYGVNAHQVVCDGENQAQTVDGAFLCNSTAAMVSRRHRQYDHSRGWITDYQNPVGSATDLWSMC